MLVDNVFQLLNKFGKEEDQISAAFGFILKNSPKILAEFLQSLKIDAGRSELKRVDIETQVSYDAGGSRIDLQIQLYDRFLVFIESKLGKSEKILGQLEKYKRILLDERPRYRSNIRLVYVSRHPIKPEEDEQLRRELKLADNEFFSLSWGELVDFTEKDPKRETVKLFRKYIGDTMNAKKEIAEQKIKEIAEVLVIFTDPNHWELAKDRKTAVQRNGTPDARYIAFLRIDRGPGKRSAITHIAKVTHTEKYVPSEETYRGYPSLLKGSKGGTHKQYILEEIVPLAREIPHLRGEGTKGQVNFKTTMSELLRVNSVGQINKPIKVSRG